MPYQMQRTKLVSNVSNEIIIVAIFFMQMKHQNENNMNQQLQDIRLQQMFKVPVSGLNTCSQPSTPFINHIFNDRLLTAIPS